MSHVMMERLLKGRTAPEKPSNSQSPNQSSAQEDSSADPWTVLEPPSLSFAELIGDLKLTWRGELKDLTWWRKLPYSGLRIIQNVAYRIGYGNDRLRARVPPPPSPDFTAMERNLQGLPPKERLAWLLDFYSLLNNPGLLADATAPRSVVLELSGNCNLNCVGCGQGRYGIKPERFMSVSSLRHWAAASCQETNLIRINGLGESTLHPHLADCLDVLRPYPGGREIISNLTASSEVYARLLDDGFVLLLSWDAADEQTMSAIRRGSDFGKMTQRLVEISRRAERYRSHRPVLLFTLREENLSHLKRVISHAGEAGYVRVTVNLFKTPDNDDWTLPKRQEVLEAFAEAEQTATTCGVELALPDHVGDLAVKSAVVYPCPRGGCRFAQEQVVIRNNGDVTPCNMLNPYLYGNLRQKPFEKVWNGPEAKLFRMRSVETRRHPYCRQCHYVDVHAPGQNAMTQGLQSN